MEKIEYYTVKPNLKQLFGRKVTKELEFDEKTENGKVRQTLKDCILTTYINNTEETKVVGLGSVKTKETTTITQELPEGVILIWSEESGYIIPNIQMTTLDELKEEIETIQDIYKGDTNDTKRDENKGI